MDDAVPAPSWLRHILTTALRSGRKVTGALKAVHDKYAKALGEREDYQAEFTEAVQHNDQIAGLLNKVLSALVNCSPCKRHQSSQISGWRTACD